MKHKVTVVVTKTDIKQGMKNPQTFDKCPIGLALNRALHRLDARLEGMVEWGGTVRVINPSKDYWAGRTQDVRPLGLNDMPGGFTGGPDGLRYIKTPRRFHFFIEL